MKLGSLAGARAYYYDRNATSVGNTYENIVTAHAETTRYTRTISSSGKKAIIECLQNYWDRRTAATTVGQLGAWVYVTSTSGTTMRVLSATNLVPDSAVGTFVYSQTPQPLTLYGGETIYGTTYHGEVGSTVYFQLALKGTEYDA
jgi:hypothetical protein